MIRPFSAQANSISLVSSSTVSASTLLPGIGNTVRISSEGPNTAYISIGTNPQVATIPTTTPVNTCTAILSGEDCVFSIPNDQKYYISAICNSSQSATLNISVGEGA